MLSRSGSSGLEGDSGRLLPDSPADSMRIARMKTRVAVRDKTPHRFQVVPLRDVSKHGGTQPANSQWPAPSQSKNNAHRNPSGKLGRYSQSRPVSSSSSIQSLLSLASATDSHELDAGWELGINNTLATTSNNKTLATFHTTSSPLRHQDLNPVLAEWDMNREEPLSRMTRNFAPTENLESGCQESLAYQGFINTSIRTELKPTSQSLHNTSRQKRNYPKFASLSRSIDIPENSPPAFSGFKNPKSSRRHAIYTKSLYVPYLDEGCEPYLQESIPRGPTFLSDSCPNLAHGLRNENPEFTNSFHLKPPAVGFCLEDSLANQIPSAFIPVPTNSFPSNGLSLLPIDKAQLATSRGLNYPTKRPSRVRLRSGKDISHTEIVYPRIVLDLCAEIDLEIEQWKPV